MRIIGLDLGSKSLGVAISDELEILARPLTTLYFPEDDYEACFNMLTELASKERVKTFVLGLPKHMNNDTGIRANISLSFKERLESSGYTCHLVDERLSTKAAHQILISQNKTKDYKQKKDELAAGVILQQFLDLRR